MNCLSLCGIALLIVSAISGQQTTDRNQDLYQEIPAQQRKSLKQALNKLVQAEKNGDWKSVYALSAKQATETEDSFVRKMKGKHALHWFRPSKVTFIPSDDFWNIQGCASFEDGKPERGQLASVHARWTNSRWFLSPVAIDLFGSEKKMTPRKCS
jgi:hypothetical protein